MSEKQPHSLSRRELLIAGAGVGMALGAEAVNLKSSVIANFADKLSSGLDSVNNAVETSKITSEEDGLLETVIIDWERQGGQLNLFSRPSGNLQDAYIFGQTQDMGAGERYYATYPITPLEVRFARVVNGNDQDGNSTGSWLKLQQFLPIEIGDMAESKIRKQDVYLRYADLFSAPGDMHTTSTPSLITKEHGEYINPTTGQPLSPNEIDQYFVAGTDEPYYP